MKNLEPYNKDTFEVHKSAVKSKNSGQLKIRLMSILPSIKIAYDNFDEEFSKNKIYSIAEKKDFDAYKEDLLTLYRYKSKIVRMVREEIRDLQISTIINTCQNCTLDSVNTLDHILPKSNFPQFVINPKNLFPCCSRCNSYKLDISETEKKRFFLNLYLDELPKEQYLFVNILQDKDGNLDFNFYLENIKNLITEELFTIIKNHYTNLHLFERMKLKSIEHISELENKIIIFKKHLPLDSIIKSLIEAAEFDKLAFGYNYWKSILEISLLNSKVFLQKFS